MIQNNLLFFCQNFETIATWLQSSEFCIIYANINHPYPPLINPKNAQNLDSTLLWNLNVPLPRNDYKFLYLHIAASASDALVTYLKLCGLEVASVDNPLHNYQKLLNLHRNKKDCIPSLMRDNDFIKDREKFAYLLRQKLPFVWIMRDPISILKTILNHIAHGFSDERILPHQQNLNLTLPYSFSLPFYEVCNLHHAPDVRYLENAINYFGIFCTQSRLEKFGNLASDFICLEVSQLNAENAFDTITELAKRLNFTPPKQSQKEIFTKRMNKSAGELNTLPATLYVHKSDLKNVFNVATPLANTPNYKSLSYEIGTSITITTLAIQQLRQDSNDKLDITQEFIGDILQENTKYDQICLLISPDDFKRLKADKKLFKATLEYLRGYIQALICHAKQIEANLLNETQILEYLKSQKELCIKLKAKLDYDLQFIHKDYKHYLQKWQYYLKFCKICKELGL